MEPVYAIVFWFSALLIVYTFAGYGLLIRALGGLARRAAAGGTAPGSARVVIVAHNEEGRIGARIRNLRESELPVEITVCSDGSTDGTARAAAAEGARVLDFARKRGKAACLNDALAETASAPLVVLADARQEFKADTIAKLARHFADPRVGAVSGILRIGAARTSTGSGVDAYWKLETALRRAESDFDSCIGCTGAVYAIRPELFTPLPEDTILDDVAIPMRIAVAGHRVLYDAEAEAFDPQPLDPRTEERRKARTLAGNFQMLCRYPEWLLPWRNRLAWQLISHKYLRLAGPWLLLGALGANAALWRVPFYAGCLGLQLAFYSLAGLGAAAPALKVRMFSIPAGFVFLNAMAAKGLVRFLRGETGGAWSGTDQPAAG